MLNDLKQEIEVINYMDSPLQFLELKNLIELLKIKPIELVRTKEAIWKEHFKDKILTDDETIQAMIDYPKLMERPIVVNGTKAVIGRPTEKIKDVI